VKVKKEEMESTIEGLDLHGMVGTDSLAYDCVYELVCGFHNHLNGLASEFVPYHPVQVQSLYCVFHLLLLHLPRCTGPAACWEVYLPHIAPLRRHEILIAEERQTLAAGVFEQVMRGCCDLPPTAARRDFLASFVHL